MLNAKKNTKTNERNNNLIDNNNIDFDLFEWHDESQTAFYDGKELKQSENANGYVYVYVARRKYRLHRLIAIKYIENDSPATKIFVDHINETKNDNRLANLQWITPSNNSLKSLQNKKRNKTKYYIYNVINHEGECKLFTKLIDVADYLQRHATTLLQHIQGQWHECNKNVVTRTQIDKQTHKQLTLLLSQQSQ